MNILRASTLKVLVKRSELLPRERFTVISGTVANREIAHHSSVHSTNPKAKPYARNVGNAACGPPNPLRPPARPEVSRVESRWATPLSAALPEGNRHIAAHPMSIDRQDHIGVALKDHRLDISKIQSFKLSDPSKPIATGTAVEVIRSFIGAV